MLRSSNFLISVKILNCFIWTLWFWHHMTNSISWLSRKCKNYLTMVVKFITVAIATLFHIRTKLLLKRFSVPKFIVMTTFVSIVKGTIVHFHIIFRSSFYCVFFDQKLLRKIARLEVLYLFFSIVLTNIFHIYGDNLRVSKISLECFKMSSYESRPFIFIL